MGGLASIASIKPFDIDVVALVWLTVTAILMVTVPAFLALVSLWIFERRERQLGTFQYRTPIPISPERPEQPEQPEQAAEKKKAA